MIHEFTGGGPVGLGPPFDPPLRGRPNLNCKFKTFGLLDIRHKI